MRAIPECITEYDMVNGREGIPVSLESLSDTVRLFDRDPDYSVKEFQIPGGKIVAAFYMRNGHEYVSSYVWHVPESFTERKCENNGCSAPVRNLEDFCSAGCWENWHADNMPEILGN